jgi:hypothetical protein
LSPFCFEAELMTVKLTMNTTLTQKGNCMRTMNWIFTLALVMTFGLLQSCGGGGGGGPVVNANPTGYYINTGSLSMVDINGDPLFSATDLQAMIYNNRIMLMSVNEGVSIDGTITSLSGNDFSATVVIYHNGVKLAAGGNADISGTISSTNKAISGSFTDSAGGSGTFTLNYASSNSEIAAISRVENNTNWDGKIGGSGFDFGFDINNIGTIIQDITVYDGEFNSCDMTGTIAPISGTNLYSVSLTINIPSCANTNVYALNNYTGLATTRQLTNPDDTLVWIVTNGSYSIASEFRR